MEQAIRSNPSLQANAAAILTRQSPAQRAIHGGRAGLRQSWVVSGYLRDRRAVRRDGAPLPQRLSFGLPSERVGAVFSWPGGVWAGTNRTAFADASLTFVGQRSHRVPFVPGPSAVGAPFDQVRELAGQGNAIWAATDLGVARVNPGDGRVELVDDSRGLPDSRVYAIVSRGGRITVGTAQRSRPDQRFARGGADRPILQRCRLRRLSGRGLGLGRDPVRRAALLCQGWEAWSGQTVSPHPVFRRR